MRCAESGAGAPWSAAGLIAMLRQRNITLPFLALYWLSPCEAQPLEDWARVSHQFLRRQMTPNPVVPDPDPSRRRLLVSYDITPAKFSVGYHRSATYDDALAVLSFIITGQMEAAALT